MKEETKKIDRIVAKAVIEDPDIPLTRSFYLYRSGTVTTTTTETNVYGERETIAINILPRNEAGLLKLQWVSQC